MLRRLVPIMLLLFVIFLLVLPAAAQDKTPESTPVVIVSPVPVVTDVPVITPAPVEQPSALGWLTQITPWLIVLGIVALLVVGVLGHAFIVQLGTSAPIALYQMVKGAATSGLDSLGEVVAKTPTQMDDVDYTELRKAFDNLVTEIDALRRSQVQLLERFTPPSSSAN